MTDARELKCDSGHRYRLRVIHVNRLTPVFNSQRTGSAEQNSNASYRLEDITEWNSCHTYPKPIVGVTNYERLAFNRLYNYNLSSAESGAWKPRAHCIHATRETADFTSSWTELSGLDGWQCHLQPFTNAKLQRPGYWWNTAREGFSSFAALKQSSQETFAETHFQCISKCF